MINEKDMLSRNGDYINITLKHWLEIKPKGVNKLLTQINKKGKISHKAEDWNVQLSLEEYKEYTKGV